MLREFSVAGLIAGAALGAVLAAATASAWSYGDKQRSNQDMQIAPVQTREDLIPLDSAFVNATILAPVNGGHRLNGPVQTSVNHDRGDKDNGYR